ncbi:unnamed protein product [Rhizophagus irregularis]|nr:unnamed protein product [Rhizophagus irregularis]
MLLERRLLNYHDTENKVRDDETIYKLIDFQVEDKERINHFTQNLEHSFVTTDMNGFDEWKRQNLTILLCDYSMTMLTWPEFLIKVIGILQVFYLFLNSKLVKLVLSLSYEGKCSLL